MRTKKDSIPPVNIWGLKVEMQPVLKNAGKIWKGLGQELVITSGRDSIHSDGSLHYYGYAADLRSRYFTEEEKRIAAGTLAAELGPDYDVVIHKTHIHAEYQKILQGL